MLAPLVRREREDPVESPVVLEPVDPLESVYVTSPHLLLSRHHWHHLEDARIRRCGLSLCCVCFSTRVPLVLAVSLVLMELLVAR